MSRCFAANVVSAGKLPLETELVTRDNNTSWTSNPGHQTSVAPYLIDNHVNRILHMNEPNYEELSNNGFHFTRHAATGEKNDR